MVLKKDWTGIAELPELLFHGTSSGQLEKLRKAAWNVTNFYLAEEPSKSWDYAEIAAGEDGTEFVLLVLDASMLNDIEPDFGVDGEEEYDMQQWVWEGNIKPAVINILINYDDINNDKYQDIMSDVSLTSDCNGFKI